jgi:hypothetical protein
VCGQRFSLAKPFGVGVRGVLASLSVGGSGQKRRADAHSTSLRAGFVRTPKIRRSPDETASSFGFVTSCHQRHPKCFRPNSSRFAKIFCPRITLIHANHDRVSSRNRGTFGVRGVLASLSMLGSIQSDTETCRTPKAARNRADILSYSRSFV